MFAHTFMQNAFLGGTFIALASGVVGYFLVLRTQLFMSDALSHVAFTGAVAALAFGLDLRLGLFAATILISVGMARLGEHGRADDVVIGVVFAFVLGLGVFFLTLFTTSRTTGNGATAVRVLSERLFGTASTRFVHTLAGNTPLTRSRGKVTKSVNPKGQACWTLAALATRLCEWAYEVYDTLEHPALGQSPREAHAAGLQLSGLRPQRHIAYDEDFRMLTLPTTQKGTAKLRPGRGIKVNYLYYWSDAFLDPDVEGTQVPVRYDPFDAGLAYAFIRKRWVRCISEHHAQLAGRSEREIQLASAELHRRHQRHNQQFRVTARQLADFLASVQGEEVVLEQRMRDAEARTTLEPLVGTPLIDPAVVAVLGADDRAEPDPELEEALSPALTDRSSHDTLVIYRDY